MASAQLSTNSTHVATTDVVGLCNMASKERKERCWNVSYVTPCKTSICQLERQEIPEKAIRKITKRTLHYTGPPCMEDYYHSALDESSAHSYRSRDKGKSKQRIMLNNRVRLESDKKPSHHTVTAFVSSNELMQTKNERNRYTQNRKNNNNKNTSNNNNINTKY